MGPIDLNRVRTVALGQRLNKVDLAGFALPPRRGQSAADFLSSFPQLLAGRDFRAVVQAIVAARQKGRPVIVAIGGHVVKCGLNPILLELMEQRIITAIAMNGSAAIHDFELALIGQTSEDVAAGLKDGTFGMVRETGELMNGAINRVADYPDRGMGDLLGEALSKTDAPFKNYSLLAAAYNAQSRVTVHVAIGADIIHMHPSASGSSIGQASFNDFRLFTTAVSDLTGGVYINIGSAVVMPEVFLKAFTVAQNLGANLQGFVTVNMDMSAHYRPGENVVRRPALVGGHGYNLIGRHELMVPLLAQAIVEAMA
jgi:hypothetical protein